MINSELRYESNPIDARNYGTSELRKHFFVDNLFTEDNVQLTCSMYDSFIVGAAMPVKKELKLETIPYLKSEIFLDLRKLGIINVGEEVVVRVNGTDYNLKKKKVLYVGKDSKEVFFSNVNGSRSMFYLNSTLAHKSFPTKKVGLEDAEVIQLGEEKYVNKRVLNKLIVNSIVETCQLQMGLTELVEGNVWNKMPPHTHARRMETCFYLDLEEGRALCHFIGETDNTRHIFVYNNQTVISPKWSMHAGAGTSNYSFIWRMAGENHDYGDMDTVTPTDLR